MRYTIAARKVAAQFQKIWKKEAFNSAIIFNDYPYTARLLIQLLRSNQNKIQLAEDGAEFYRSSKLAVKSTLECRLLQVLFGIKWKQIEIIGDSIPDAEIYAISPQNVRKELAYRPKLKISNEPLIKLDANAALEYLGEPLIPTENTSAPPLILLPHSESAPNMLNQINLILKVLAIEPTQIQLKPHPREHPAALSKLKRHGYQLLPTETPTELYILAQRTSQLIGGYSTALYSAKWLQPKMEIHSCSALQSSKDPNLDKFFSKIGIRNISLD